jgi:Carboxypeptidase regulatory-like domain
VCADPRCPSHISAQQRTNAQTVSGVVVDVTGTVLPNAEVVLGSASGATVQTTTTDATGTSRFDGVAPGRYEARVAFEGCRPTTVRVTVGTRAPSPLRVTLALAAVKQEASTSASPTTSCPARARRIRAR